MMKSHDQLKFFILTLFAGAVLSVAAAQTRINQVPQDNRLLSMEFDTIELRSVFAILEDFLALPIDTKEVNNVEMKVSLFAINPSVVFESLLDCYGYKSEKTDLGYKILQGGFPSTDPEACFVGRTTT